jgi:hypothetical protein
MNDLGYTIKHNNVKFVYPGSAKKKFVCLEILWEGQKMILNEKCIRIMKVINRN